MRGDTQAGVDISNICFFGKKDVKKSDLTTADGKKLQRLAESGKGRYKFQGRGDTFLRFVTEVIYRTLFQ